jgi:signal transduction histidine kinase
MKVLVAYASPEARARVRSALEALTSFDVQGSAANLEVALRTLAGSAPDLVVTDASFPDGDGVRLIQAARRHAASPAVVVFSAAESAGLRERCLDAGADLYLPEHAGLAELQRLARDLAVKRRADREAAGAAHPANLAAGTDSERTERAAAVGVGGSAANERFNMIGRIAGGVAHDLINYFAVVELSLSSLALQAKGAESPELTDARTAMAVATRLTRSLLDYARGSAPPPAPVDLASVARRTLELIGRMIPSEVQLHLDIDEDLPPVRGVASELEQLILNLLINACDAMPEGGHLWLGLRTSSASSVMLEIADSGRGVSADVVTGDGATSRSSKADRHGDGLGLGIVRSVVERHGASLLIGPRPGGGTRFLVRLSSASGASGAPTPSPSPAKPTTR